MTGQTLSYRWKGAHHRVPKRDTQKSKLYRAEAPLLKCELLGGGDLDATIAFVRKVEASGTWDKINHDNYTIAPKALKVKDGRGCRFARGGRRTLVFPRWARRPVVILHEMAHSATPGANHNWPFCATLLTLVARFMGAEARDQLKAEMRKNRVRFTPPRKFSEEHMAKLRAQGHRLAAARKKEEA